MFLKYKVDQDNFQYVYDYLDDLCDNSYDIIIEVILKNLDKYFKNISKKFPAYVRIITKIFSKSTKKLSQGNLERLLKYNNFYDNSHWRNGWFGFLMSNIGPELYTKYIYEKVGWAKIDLYLFDILFPRYDTEQKTHVWKELLQRMKYDIFTDDIFAQIIEKHSDTHHYIDTDYCQLCYQKSYFKSLTMLCN
eukprot:UN25984